MDSNSVLTNLKTQGFKITQSRRLIIEILLNAKSPISVMDIIAAFSVVNIPINKTTVYRELTFLRAQGVVIEIDLGEGKKRYEIDTKNHHHHIVCVNCERIEDIPFENHLEIQEKKIQTSNQFKVLNHTLEFFGLCKECQ